MFANFFGQFDNIYWFFFDLAIILLVTKMFGLLMKKIGLPQVIGSLIGGLLVGPAVLGIVAPAPDSTVVGPGINAIAQIGVVMLMFSAGLETDLKELKKSGWIAGLIAFAGVALPLGAGFLVSHLFNMGGGNVYRDLFIGVILTATSVAITVETLREMGKLKGKVGTAILSAAIIDDVIGIILLTLIANLANGASGNAQNFSGWVFGLSGVWGVILNTILFFGVAIGLGYLVNKLFKWLGKKYEHKRRVPIFGLVFCFLMAFMAEVVFGVAEITGAFLAGMMLSGKDSTDYVGRKIDISSYMIFTPVFFAHIGLDADFAGITGTEILFALVFVAVGVLTKYVGCGGAAKLCKFSWRDSSKIGIGMIARGEVALIVAAKGMAEGLIDPSFATIVMVLVIITSLLTPILLKVTYKHDGEKIEKLPEDIAEDEAYYNEMTNQGLEEGEDVTENVASNEPQNVPLENWP